MLDKKTKNHWSDAVGFMDGAHDQAYHLQETVEVAQDQLEEWNFDSAVINLNKALENYDSIGVYLKAAKKAIKQTKKAAKEGGFEYGD